MLSREEHEVLQEAELSGQADSENNLGGSSKTICITSDWKFTRSPATGRNPDEDRRNTVKRSCLCCRESGSHGPRSSVVFLNPSRSLGLSVAYESVMTFAEDRSDLD